MDLLRILKSFRGIRVLVLGDLMLDEYVRGEITRISPEAPVPVILAKSHNSTLGGAANVASNCTALGANVKLVGVIGDDSAGSEFLRMAEGKGLVLDLEKNSICVDSSRQTTRKMRVFAGGSQLARVDFETPIPIRGEIEMAILASYDAGIQDVDCIIVSDYNKGVVTKSLSKKLIDLAKKAGVPILIDSKNFLSFGMRGATILKPNLKELSAETGLPCGTDDEIEKAGLDLFQRLAPNALLVTAGERGMFLFTGGRAKRIPGIKVDVADVSGAGDTVISVMALAVARKSSMQEAAIIANYAAACAISKDGTAASNADEIAAFVKRKGGMI